MSDLSRTVEIIFAGVDNVSSELNSMGGKIDSFGNDLSDFGEPFKDAADMVGKLVLAIGGIATAGVIASSDIDNEAKKMQLSLGLPNKEAEKFEDIAKRVYNSGVTADLETAFRTVTTAQKKFGDDASIDIGKVSDAALKISNVFDVDVDAAMTSAKGLMDNFGITVDEAFGFILSGFQGDLDSSGDLLDSIDEYGTQFRDMGLDAGEAYSIIESGIQGGGTLGTDKVLDLFKEFRIKITGNSKEVQDALTDIGIDPVQFKKDLDSGAISFADAFGKIQTGLKTTTDKTGAFKSGVALLGTPFEDLGTKATLEIDTTKTKIDEFQGKLDDFDDETFKKNLLASWNTIKTDFGDMEQWDVIKEKVGEVFKGIADSFGPALEDVDFSELSTAVEDVWDDIANIFKENDIDITTIEGMSTAIGIVVDSMESVFLVAGGIVEVLAPVVDGAIAITNKFNDMDPDTKELVGNLIAIGTAVGVIGTALTAGGAVFMGLGTLASYFGASGVLRTAITGTIGSLTGSVGLTAALGTFSGVLGVGAAVIAAGALGYKIGDYLNGKIADADGSITALTDKVKNYSDEGGNVDLPKNIMDLDQKTLNASARFDVLKNRIEELPSEVQADIKTIFFEEGVDAAIKAIGEVPAEKKTNVSVDADTGNLDDLTGELQNIPDETTTDVYANADLSQLVTITNKLKDLPEEQQVLVKALMDAGQFKAAIAMLEKLPPKKEITIEAETGTAKKNIKKFGSMMIETLDDGSVVIVQTDVDEAKLKKATKDIKTDLTPLKKFEIEASVDKAKLEAAASMFNGAMSVVSTEIEWKAKIDIAKIESESKQVVAAFDSIGKSVEAVSGTVGSMFGDLLGGWDDLGSWDQMDFMGLLEDEMDMQEKLIDAQIKLLNAQAKRMDSGDPIGIKVESSNLAPALEMIFKEILEMTQTTANAEGLALLGMK